MSRDVARAKLTNKKMDFKWQIAVVSSDGRPKRKSIGHKSLFMHFIWNYLRANWYKREIFYINLSAFALHRIVNYILLVGDFKSIRNYPIDLMVVCWSVCVRWRHHEWANWDTLCDVREWRRSHHSSSSMQFATTTNVYSLLSPIPLNSIDRARYQIKPDAAASQLTQWLIPWALPSPFVLLTNVCLANSCLHCRCRRQLCFCTILS